MTTLFSFLLGAAGPLAVRVLMALGIGTLAFTGVTESMEGLVSYVQGAWGGVPADLLGLATLAGAPSAIGMILGAMTARVGIWVATSVSRLAFVSP